MQWSSKSNYTSSVFKAVKKIGYTQGTSHSSGVLLPINILMLNSESEANTARDKTWG